MDEVLTATLRDAVAARLNYLERLAREGDQTCKATLADTEVEQLTAVIRALLAEHAADGTERCPACRTAWWRRSRCTVWTLAYRHLIGDNPARRTRTRSLRPATP